MKNTANNNTQDLLPVPAEAKPISSAWATAAQLAAALPFISDLDETFLRNRAREINPRTGAPWIPKPRNNQFEINPTIIGLLEWFYTRAKEKDGLPTHYGSMLDLQSALYISPKSIKWLRKNGRAPEAKDAANRVDPRPVLKGMNAIIEAVADGNIQGVEGLETWNKDTEWAQKLREETIAQRRKNLIDLGETLLSKDADFAINSLVADQLIWEKMLQPLRALLVNAPKNINRQHRTALAAANVPAPVVKQCANVVQNAFVQLLDKLRAKKPARLKQETE